MSARSAAQTVCGATNLAKLADVADALALEGAEVRCDAAVLEVDDTSEGLVEE